MAGTARRQAIRAAKRRFGGGAASPIVQRVHGGGHRLHLRPGGVDLRHALVGLRRALLSAGAQLRLALGGLRRAPGSLRRVLGRSAGVGSAGPGLTGAGGSGGAAHTGHEDGQDAGDRADSPLAGPEDFGENVYDARYYGDGRDPGDRAGFSGYERYDRDTSNADVAAYLLWRHFDVGRTLDVGCATGFVVEALRELAVDAKGVDVSHWAVAHPASGATGHIRYGDLQDRLPFADASFDLVSAFETLEHLEPEAVPSALVELRRVTNAYVVATIPSFGRNAHGPGGWYQRKVREELLPRYWAHGDGYDGPVPLADIERDATGEPLEGHLTLASFEWWTARFADAGFVRLGGVERSIHPHLARFGLTKFWNLYVFALPEAQVPEGAVRDDEVLAERERLWRLDARTPDPEDEQRVHEALTTPGGGPPIGIGEIPAG